MFSGVVKIADIDDYITPSQNCIKPIMPINDVDNKLIKNSKMKLKIEGDYNIFQDDSIFPSRPDLIKIKDKDRQTAKVSLNDCLACNGCVTTAETLLIQQQSLEEFLKNCSIKSNINIVCISNQSLISIAHFYNITEEKALLKLGNLFESMNVSFLFNLNISNKIALAESYEEFKAKVLSPKDNNNYILCSECPGWICYAEKIIGQWIIPHCSQVKSGQQIMGNLIKQLLSKILKKDLEDINVTCIMPCFDKKLEASRENYKINGEIKEVDTVITSSELIEFLEQNKFQSLEMSNQKIVYNFSSFMKKVNNTNQDILDTNYLRENYKLTEDEYKVFFEVDENSSSNGYTEIFLKAFLNESFNSEIREKVIIERKNIKNSDFREINVSLEGKEIISFAIIYGLKNIKILTKSLEKKKSKYAYIEIMACPSGCLNGGYYVFKLGGQLKAKDPNVKARDLVKIFEAKIAEKSIENSNLRSDIKEEYLVLKSLIQNILKNVKWNDIFGATYKEIDKSLLNGLNIKW